MILCNVARRWRLLLLAGAGGCILAANPALAQRSSGELKLYDDATMARRAAAASDPAEALGRYLRVLARDPADLDALIGAGRAALDIGDPNAAINFLARAEQIAPHNGRVKAGLGSAMIQLVQPKSALKLFEEAVSSGVPLADIAADRGLAYDLRGDNKRARADYEMAIRAQPSPELTRRLALSMAMGGDTVGALAALDPLLRKQDKAAWRDRAFVLAISGDLKGAQDTANAVLPRSQAQALSPFLTRLPKLRASQQAAAVHFGQFPYDGQQYSESQLFAAAGGYVAPSTPAASVSSPKQRTSRGSRSDEEGDGVDLDLPAKSSPSRSAPSARTEAAKIEGGKLAVKSKSESISPEPPLRIEKPRLQVAASVMDASSDVSIGKSARGTPPGDKAVSSNKTSLSRPDAKDEKSTRNRKDASSQKQNSADKEGSAGKKGETEKGASAKSKATKTAAAKEDTGKSKAALAKKEPERHWVQVATGAYKPDLGKEWSKLKARHPAVLGRQSPWTVPLNRTNRLLVGPFKTADEAQAFVNKAAGAGVSASRFSSSAGQAVERLVN